MSAFRAPLERYISATKTLQRRYDDEEDEWDEPTVFAPPAATSSSLATGTLTHAATAVGSAAPTVADGAFSRSVRSFRAAGVLAAGAADEDAARNDHPKHDVLSSLARSYNALAADELRRLGA